MLLVAAVEEDIVTLVHVRFDVVEHGERAFGRCDARGIARKSRAMRASACALAVRRIQSHRVLCLHLGLSGIYYVL